MVWIHIGTHEGVLLINEVGNRWSTARFLLLDGQSLLHMPRLLKLFNKLTEIIGIHIISSTCPQNIVGIVTSDKEWSTPSPSTE